MNNNQIITVNNFKELFNEWNNEIDIIPDSCSFCSQIKISTDLFIQKRMEYLILRINLKDILILSCPSCGQFYEYTSWMSSPDWGEAMEGIVEPYLVEMLYKRNIKDIIEILEKYQRKGTLSLIFKKYHDLTRKTIIWNEKIE